MRKKTSKESSVATTKPFLLAAAATLGALQIATCAAASNSLESAVLSKVEQQHKSELATGSFQRSKDSMSSLVISQRPVSAPIASGERVKPSGSAGAPSAAAPAPAPLAPAGGGSSAGAVAAPSTKSPGGSLAIAGNTANITHTIVPKPSAAPKPIPKKK